MLIDDDSDDRQFFCEALNQIDEAISCVSASNGLDALLYLKNEANLLPDYIFLDLRMHGISGKKCLEEIKKDSRLFSVPVIVYTTSRDVKESIELKKMGAAHFMSKPTSPDDIYYMLSVVLGDKWR